MEGDIIMVTELDNGDDVDWWVGYAKNKIVRGKFPKKLRLLHVNLMYYRLQNTRVWAI